MKLIMYSADLSKELTLTFADDDIRAGLSFTEKFSKAEHPFQYFILKYSNTDL